jgi:alpha-D-xyloside xylohydrolase
MIHRRRIVALALSAATSAVLACSGASPLPDPVTIAAREPRVSLRVRTRGTLSFTLERDGRTVLAPHVGEGPQRAALAFGVVAAIEPARYYDPERADTERGVVWHEAGEILTARRVGTAIRLDVALRPGPGRATVHIEASDRDGVRVDSSVLSAAGTIVFTRLGITAPEGPLYGGGESFTGYDGRGQAWPMQMRADGAFESSTNERHVPIPFVTDKRGAALFVETHHPGVFDLARTTPSRLELTFAATTLRAHFIAAPSAPAAVESLSRLTAMPRLPPTWAFAPFQWRNEHRNMAEVLEDARAMRTHAIPGGVVWIDNPWQTAFSTFVFNPIKYAGAREAIAELNRIGYRVMLWTCPYINVSDDSATRPGMTRDNFALLEEATLRRLLVSWADTGEPFIVPWGFGRGVSVDFSGEGRAWYAALAANVVSLGVDGFKLDYGEETVPELLGMRIALRFANGEGVETMHRRHSIGFQKSLRSALRAGGREGFLLGRASAFGGQAEVDAIWPGDLDNDFTLGDLETRTVGGLRGALSGAVALAMSGFPSYGSDIGGYRRGAPSEELLLRWAAFQATLPIMQLGGGGDHHNPWLPPYSAAAIESYRRLARLHIDLFPYLQVLAKQASETGTPYVLPPPALFPDDAGLDSELDTFMVGDALFVAPIVFEGATSRRVRLPPGRWMEVREQLAGRNIHEGSSEIEVTAAGAGELPLYLRVGTALLLGMPDVATLSTSADPTIVSGASFDGRARIFWAPDLRQSAADPAATCQPPCYIRKHPFSPGFRVEAQARALAVTNDATAPLSQLHVEVALAPAASSPVTVELDGIAIAPNESANLATCERCARWDPGGTLAISLRGAAIPTNRFTLRAR